MIRNIVLFLLAQLVCSNAQFTVQPISVRQAEGLEAVIECLHPGATAYSWAIDGTFQSDYPSGITAVNPSGNSPATLTIPAIPQYNNTVVQCEAAVRVGGRLEGVLSENATLLVQGPLRSISNLQLASTSSSITISWDAPFSLDLTTAEPNIQYCVDVYDITGVDVLVKSICDITEEVYNFSPDNPDQTRLFRFTVTPRSNISRALNGTTSEPVTGFFVTQSTFTTYPMTVTQAEGLETVFECLHPGATHSWFVNGIHQAESSFPQDVVIVPSLAGNSPATLIIPAIPQYNNTVVQCEAAVRVGGRFAGVLSNFAVLLVQGPLMEVSHLNVSMTSSSITITWDAPFSLNLTDVEPDIQYCVDVYNVTGGGDELVESTCNVIVTSFIFTPDTPSPDHLFNFTVTPRSNVPGAVNGTRSEPVQGYFLGDPLPIPSDRVHFQSNSVLDPILLAFPVEVLGTSPGRLPTNYTVEISDIATQWLCSCLTDDVIISNSVGLTLQCYHDCTINRHQIYSVTIVAYNRGGRSKSSPFEISTHDVQIITAVHFLRHKLIEVECSYLNGSTVGGLFTIVYSPGNLSDITYHVVHRDGLEPITNFSFPKVRGDVYNIGVFDLEGNGLPEERPAVTPQVVTTNLSSHGMSHSGTSQSQSPPSSLHPRAPPEVTTSNGKICASCSFTDTEVIGCVGVIHSAQLDNLTLTILPVERSVGMNCTNKTLNEGEYFVAVFGQLADGLEESPVYVTTVSVESSPSTTPVLPPVDETPAPATSLEIIAGVVLAVLVAMVVLIGIITVCVCIIQVKRKTKRCDLTRSDQSHDRDAPIVDGRVDWSTTFAGIEQPNEAYSLVLKKNSAYEKTRPHRQRNQQRQPAQPLAPVEENAESERVDLDTVPHKYEEVILRDAQSPLTTPEIQQGTESGVEYMNTVPCDYEEMVPQQQQHPVDTTQEVRVGGTEEGDYMNTVALQKDTKYENVVPQGAPHKAYVN